MPIYTYLCPDCQHTFEKISRMTDYKIPEYEPCPTCGESNVRQIINCHFERMAPDQVGRVRPHDDWKDHLKNIKKNNPKCADFNMFR